MAFVSMTGFGRSTMKAQTRRGSIEILVEIKTVNSRYLDLHIRTPKDYGGFDSRVQEVLREFFSRGRIDVNYSSVVVEGAFEDLAVNKSQARALFRSLSQVRTELGIDQPITLNDLLRVPDWLTPHQNVTDLEDEWTAVAAALRSACKQVQDTRSKEGQSLEMAVRIQMESYKTLFEQIRALRDRSLESLRDRTRQRVLELAGRDGIDPNRLEQEIVLWIARSDFQEEVDRIQHHLGTFDELHHIQGPVGRKLEFVIQELQRETNTLGTKCPDARVMPQIIELKTCIERIREQIQNIE